MSSLNSVPGTKVPEHKRCNRYTLYNLATRSQSRWLDQEAMLAMLDDREAILDGREAICVPSKYLLTSENDLRLSEEVTISQV